MLSIYICEDDPKQKTLLTRNITELITLEELDMRVELATKDPHELLRNIEGKQETGIYFLDVDLQSDINGMELGQRIRKHDPRGFIVFITTHAEMSTLTFTYKVEALDYIVKDDITNLRPRIKDCLLNINDKYATPATDVQKSFYVKSKEKTVHMAYDSIFFFETATTSHKIILHADTRSIEFYGQMSDVEERLDGRFLRCHRSFIINMDHVLEIDKSNNTVRFTNGQTCLVSSRAMRHLKKAL